MRKATAALQQHKIPLQGPMLLLQNRSIKLAHVCSALSLTCLQAGLLLSGHGNSSRHAAGGARLRSRAQPAQSTNFWLLSSVRESHHTFSQPSSSASGGDRSLAPA